MAVGRCRFAPWWAISMASPWQMVTVFENGVVLGSFKEAQRLYVGDIREPFTLH